MKNARIALLGLFLTGTAWAQPPIVGPSINLQPNLPAAVRSHQLKSDARNTGKPNNSHPAPNRGGGNTTTGAATSEAANAPALHRSAADGRVDTVKEAVEKNPQLVKSRDASGYTALHHAAIGGHADVVQVLLDSGADINARGSGGETPLLLAAAKGNLEVVELLVKNGADVNKPGADQRTPLHKAAMAGDLDTVKALLAAGADPTLTDRSGKTAADLAEHYRAGDYMRVVDALDKH